MAHWSAQCCSSTWPMTPQLSASSHHALHSQQQVSGGLTWDLGSLALPVCTLCPPRRAQQSSSAFTGPDCQPLLEAGIPRRPSSMSCWAHVVLGRQVAALTAAAPAVIPCSLCLLQSTWHTSAVTTCWSSSQTCLPMLMRCVRCQRHVRRCQVAVVTQVSISINQSHSLIICVRMLVITQPHVRVPFS